MSPQGPVGGTSALTPGALQQETEELLVLVILSLCPFGAQCVTLSSTPAVRTGRSLALEKLILYRNTLPPNQVHWLMDELSFLQHHLHSLVRSVDSLVC